MIDIKTFLIGHESPYIPVKRVFPWIPMIFTVWWWRWCMAHGWRLGVLRLHTYWIRYCQPWIKTWLIMQTVCLVKGHKMHHDVGWSYSRDRCDRCRRSWNFKSNY